MIDIIGTALQLPLSDELAVIQSVIDRFRILFYLISILI